MPPRDSSLHRVRGQKAIWGPRFLTSSCEAVVAFRNKETAKATTVLCGYAIWVDVEARAVRNLHAVALGQYQWRLSI